MIAGLRLGRVRERGTRDEQIAESKRVQALLANEDFGNLLADAADDIISRWDKEKNAEVRAGLWYELQGLRALERRMAAIVENGLRLSQ